MTSSDIDEAIAALSDEDYESLLDATTKHWTFTAQIYALPSAAFLIFSVAAFLLHRLVWSFWPGSLIAATAAALVLLSLLWLLLKAIMSQRMTDWRLRSAMRRMYRIKAGANTS